MSTHFAGVARYRVDSLGRAGRSALVVDSRTHAIVLEIGGPDRFATADRVADALNQSRTETPVRP
jgi:hypothetical protein